MVKAEIRAEAEMKDSGIQWIGKIPKHCGMAQIKRFFHVQAGGDAKPEYYAYEKDEVHKYPVYTNSANKNQIYAYTSKSIFDKGTITVAGRGTLGVAFLRDTPYDAIIRLLSVSARDKRKVVPKFWEYWFNATNVTLDIQTTVGQLSAKQFEVKPAIVMPVEEQRAIAAYLDKVCGNIDEIMAEARASIEEYKQLRESVISEATTRGIRKNRSMKASGIDWLPEIPADWDVISPKVLFTPRKDRAIKGERQLTASQKYGIIYQDDYMREEGVRVVTVEKDFGILKHVEPDDFVISMRSFQGGLEYSYLRGCISSAYVMLIPNHKYAYSEYYKWLFKSNKYINALQSTSDLIRDGQALRYANFVKLKLFIVPIDEQKEIADYLNNEIPKIDSLVAEKQALISDLAAYKKSLIYELVTGKRRVV